jgi:molybdenum cofactor cytidylyltransferase
VIAAVVLAAGAARRMGRPKQLLPLAGRSLVWHVANAASRSVADEIIVVTGARQAAVAAALAGLPVRLVANSRWRSGQASSLITGLKAVGPEAAAVIFLLADQPLVTPALIDALIAAYRAGRGSIVVPVAGGVRGNPVLFDLALWRPALLALGGDAGARAIIAAHPEQMATVPVADGAVFTDVDTPADYELIQRLYEKINSGGC